MNNDTLLIVLTSHDTLGETGKKTGFHYEELTTPYLRFIAEDFNVELASIKGGEPPSDPSSLTEPIQKNPASVQQFLEDVNATKALKETIPVSKLNADDYAGIYLPGGHGTMWDFPENPDLNRLISDFYQQGKVVASICHGAAGFIGAKDSKGSPIVKGKRINCFTDAEEQEVGLDKTVPFLLESALRDLGAKFEHADKFQKHVAIDHNIITGQNPASASLLADHVIRFLTQ